MLNAPKPPLLLGLMALGGCAAAPPPVIAPADAIACAALPPPTSSVQDTPQTRARADVIFTVWACTCAPALAVDKGLKCTPASSSRLPPLSRP